MKRRFSIFITVNFEDEYDAEIELDQKVIDAVTDEWRSVFYNLHTPEQIAEHIAFNLFVNNSRLSSLDGWADLSDDMAVIITYPYFREDYDNYNTDYEFEAEEIKTKN
jgi:hypothetical protein